MRPTKITCFVCTPGAGSTAASREAVTATAVQSKLGKPTFIRNHYKFHISSDRPRQQQQNQIRAKPVCFLSFPVKQEQLKPDNPHFYGKNSF